MMLGNLSTEEIEARLGIEFPAELTKWMNKTRQHSAQKIAAGKWHCFDIPFVMVCGDMETATKIYQALIPQSESMKDALKISIQN